MLNVKFTLADGSEIFPIYMDKEKRRKLKEIFEDKSEVMWCSCRSDKKLFYALSENLHFYPEHHGYEHSQYCIRYNNADKSRKTAMIYTDEESTTVYLQFNPKNFTIPSAKANDSEEDDIIEDDTVEEIIVNKEIEDLAYNATDENEVIHLKQIKVENKYKEPNFNLASLVRAINYDTFMERAINHKPILSVDYFLNAIYGRLKKIYISGLSKNLKSLSLEEDGVKFFYAPFVGCEIKKSDTYTSYNVKMKSYDSKIYSLFTFGDIYEKALKRFHRTYGIEPDDNTMVAGFQYYLTSKRGNQYKVLGRIHLFQSSEHGLYCNSLYEQKCYNFIINYLKNSKTQNTWFYIPPEEEIINGVIEIEGCHRKGIIIIPSTKEAKDYICDKEFFEPWVIRADSELKEDMITSFIKKIKGTE